MHVCANPYTRWPSGCIHGSADKRTSGITVGRYRFPGLQDRCQESCGLWGRWQVQIEGVEETGRSRSGIGRRVAEMEAQDSLQQPRRLGVCQYPTERREASEPGNASPMAPETCGNKCRDIGKDRLAYVPPITGIFPHSRRCGRENRTGIALAFDKQNHVRPVRAIDYSEQTRRPATVDRGYCSQESGCKCFHSSQLAHLSRLLFLSVPTAGMHESGKLLRRMVPRDGVEPPTPAFSGLRSTT